jgi:hypothetical protein
VTLRIGVGITGFDAGALDFVREAERLGAYYFFFKEFWA